MKIVASVGCVFSIIIVAFCFSCTADFNSAGPVQIVVPVNHSFELEIDELKHILDADEIKDRHVVVVSIAGALRQGKSFLLNFFLKYLYAEVRTKRELKLDHSIHFGFKTNCLMK